MILSPEQGRYLDEMFPSFLARQNLCDDSKHEIALQNTDFHIYNNSPNSKLYMSISFDNKPNLYVKKQVPSIDDGKKYYSQSIENEKEIFLKNLENKKKYEHNSKSIFFNCENANEIQYSPFLSVGNIDEKNILKLPFYPSMSLRYLISQKAHVSDTDKQIWAYELACAFANLHQRGYSHTYFTSRDAFLTPNLIDGDTNSQNIHLNIVLGNFSYDLESEQNKSKLSEQFYYRCPEFINEPLVSIPKSTIGERQKNDVHAFGVFLIELYKWEEPQSFLQGKTRKDRLDLINKKSPEEYLNIDINQTNNSWISLILQCVDKKPANRPTFNDIKKCLASQQNFLPNVNPQEFEDRIKNVRTDTTCCFETLAYANKKYPNFQIVRLILEDIRNEVISQYSIKYDIEDGKSVVDQIYSILNSSLYYLQASIKHRKDFFTQLIRSNFDEIIKTYTKNEYLISLIKKLILGDENLKNEDQYSNYRIEIMRIAHDLNDLSDYYYEEQCGESNTDFFSFFHAKDVEFLYNQFKKSIPISEGQIRIIYENLFNFDYPKSIEFLTNLLLISDFNSNYFSSLEKVYNILNSVSKNSENLINQVNTIFKSIYQTIYTSINKKITDYLSNDAISSLVNKVDSMINCFNEKEKSTIFHCINVIKKGIKIEESSNYTILSYAEPAINSILNSAYKRAKRLQSKTICIHGVSKSSLRSYLTRIIKNYQSSYIIEITIKLEKDGHQIKMADINEILRKLGITNIITQPNSLSFEIKGECLS